MIKDFEPESTMPKAGAPLSAGVSIPIDSVQRADLNRGRAYLADVAERRGVKIFVKYEAVIQHTVELCSRARGFREEFDEYGSVATG